METPIFCLRNNTSLFNNIRGFSILNEYHFLISTLSKVFMTSGIVFFFTNIFFFSRIGEIFIEENELIIENKKSQQTIDLNSIQEITIGKEYRNLYYLKILESNVIIELNKYQIVELKNILTGLNIKIKHRHFTDRIPEW